MDLRVLSAKLQSPMERHKLILRKLLPDSLQHTLTPEYLGIFWDPRNTPAIHHFLKHKHRVVQESDLLEQRPETHQLRRQKTTNGHTLDVLVDDQPVILKGSIVVDVPAKKFWDVPQWNYTKPLIGCLAQGVKRAFSSSGYAGKEFTPHTSMFANNIHHFHHNEHTYLWQLPICNVNVSFCQHSVTSKPLSHQPYQVTHIQEAWCAPHGMWVWRPLFINRPIIVPSENGQMV